jgi:hypothetical protein
MHQKGELIIDGKGRKEKFAGKSFRDIVKYYVRTLTVAQIANQMADILDGMESTPKRIGEWAAVGFSSLAQEKKFWKRDWLEVADEIRSTSSTYFQRLGEAPSEEALLDIVQIVVLSLAYAEKSKKALDKSTIIRKTI